MNGYNEFEYTVKKKSEGSYKRNRILMILLYVAFGMVYFFGCAIMHLYQIIAFIVLLEWILVFFTWKYVSIEYKYSTSSGKIIFSTIYGEKTTKKTLELAIKDCDVIAPATSEQLEGVNNVSFEKKYDFSPSKDCSDKYFATFKNSDGKENIVYFQATEGALKVLKYYNTNTVVAKTER